MQHNLSRRTFLNHSAFGLAAAAVTAGLSCDPGNEQSQKPEKPNFVFILIDDMGWRDLTCYGSSFFKTPNIDRLASQGMKFTDAYAAAPICSPTRASLMTGKYPARLRITDWIKGFDFPKAKLKIPNWTKELGIGETTIAEMLKKEGYVSANIGKWHLGDKGLWPEDQGFDVNLAGYHAGLPPSYFYPYENPEAYFGNKAIPNLPGGKEGEYLTDRLTDEALKFIEDNRDNPFFLYLSHYAVHTPIQAKEEKITKYEASADPETEQYNAIYAAMIESVDEGVGRIMDRLDELNVSDNTVIIFVSDNGGLLGFDRWPHITSNKPLRGGKGTQYEGGVRVPMIVRWPGVVKEGSVCHTPVISTDFFPTLAEMAGVENSSYHIDDGTSIMPLLKQESGFDREAVYFHFPHYNPVGATPYSAVRKGDYKLIQYYEDDSIELFNLKDDIGETINLSESMSEKASELQEMLAVWLDHVNAQIPEANPAYEGGESLGQWILAD
ncbi:sulfatase [Candidatus Latescibacterota bacterium]